MNKQKSYLAIAIILGLLITSSALFFYKLQKDKIQQDSICLSDSDCVKVQTSCCPCSSGGQEICALKSEQEVYIKQLENCSSRMVCTQVYNCNQKTCGCSNRKCVEV